MCVCHLVEDSALARVVVDQDRPRLNPKTHSVCRSCKRESDRVGERDRGGERERESEGEVRDRESDGARTWIGDEAVRVVKDLDVFIDRGL